MQPIDSSLFPHLSVEYRSVLERMAAALGDQAAFGLLASSPEQQLGRLGQFESFSNAQKIQGEQTMQEQLQAAASLTAEMLRPTAESREALERVVNVVAGAATSLSSAASAPTTRAPVYEQSRLTLLTQLIDKNEQMLSFAISNLRGCASEWAYSTLLAGVEAFETWDVFRTKVRAMFQPPNNKVLLQGRFFAMKQGKLSLERYVQKMRSLRAAIMTSPLLESVKVPAFLNGLNAGPARQVLYRRLSSTMEDIIRIAFVDSFCQEACVSTK